MSHDDIFVVDIEFRGNPMLDSLPSQRCKLASTAVVGDLNEVIRVIRRENGLVGMPLQYLLRRGNVGELEPAPKDLDTPLAEFADAARKVRVVLKPPESAPSAAGPGVPAAIAGAGDLRASLKYLLLEAIGDAPEGAPAAKRPRLAKRR